MRKFFAVVLAAWATAGMAQVPTGQFNYGFTNTPLWDLSGIYTNNTVTDDVVIVTMDCEANGQITDTRSETYASGADDAEYSGAGTGRILVRAGVVGAKLESAGAGSGVENGISYLATYEATGTWIINPDSLTIFDSVIGRICIVRGRCETLTGGATLPLPDGMTGDWTLDTDITPAGRGLTGTGTITLSNGRQLNYEITGSYNARRQTATLRLVGIGDALGTRLTVTTFGAGMTLTQLQGKVLGQKLNVR